MSSWKEKNGELFFGEQGCCIPNITPIQISLSQLKEFVHCLKSFKKNLERVFSESSSFYTKDLKKTIQISQEFFAYVNLSKEQRRFFNQRTRKLLKFLNNPFFSHDIIFNELKQLLLFFFSVVKSFEISNYTLEKLIKLLRKIEFILIRYESTGNEYSSMNLKRPKGIMNVNEVPEEAVLNEVPEEAALSEVPKEAVLSKVPEESVLNEVPEESALSEVSEESVLSKVPEEAVLNEVPIV
ncbi:collagen-like repeat preface domain-containing protein [Bacillus cereus]|uniref:collagen-like repeat preface domain-containing protein n=1 Tax=Bacillus cereus TaxID=1396 RepID=UPI0035CCA950